MIEKLEAQYGDVESFNISLYPYKDSKESVRKGRHFTLRNSYTSTYIGAYFEFDNGTSSFTLYDFSVPNKPQSDWFSNLRFPMYF
jgi:hypothetical protein